MPYQSSALAWLVLFSWPVVTWILVRRLPVAQAVILGFVCAHLILPVRTSLDLPLLPPIGKVVMAALSLVMVLYFRKQPVLPATKTGTVKLVLLLVILAPMATYWTNRDPLVFTQLVLPGLGLVDYLGLLFNTGCMVFIPFALGYRYLNTDEGHEKLVKYIFVAGLIYTLPVLWEIRMSPQLHRVFYGYFPHEFAQQVRYGGFRPVVFIGHGLFVALFLALATVAGFTTWRAAPPERRKRCFIGFAYLLGVLILCKSVGSILLTFIFIGLMWFVTQRIKMLSLSILMAVLIVFPAFRASEYFPGAQLIETAMKYDPDRAQSLEFRVNNENALIEHTEPRKLFGWGSWGRNFVRDAAGNSNTVVDSHWIIVYSVYGWLGFIPFFCIYPMAVLTRARAAQRVSWVEHSPYTQGLLFMLALNVVDAVVNGSITTLSALIAGALWGSAHQLPARPPARRRASSSLASAAA